MNFLILLLLIPLSFAGAPPNCLQLGAYIEGYERDLQRKSITGCTPEFYKSLVGDIPLEDPSFLQSRACQDLSTIEAQLSQAKLELEVLNGIDKLKVAVQEAKEDVSEKKDTSSVMNFVSSLNMAQSLELLLQSETAGEKPKSFLIGLKEFDPTKRITPKDLRDRILELCANKPKDEVNACNPELFRPDEGTVKEVFALINSNHPTPKLIQKWKDQLAIKKKNPVEGEDDSYSFVQMQLDLKPAMKNLDNGEVLGKRQIAAIEALDEFESAKGFSFVENLSGIKDKKAKKIASDKFFLLMGDAKKRQQYEVQSKVSNLWDEVKNSVKGLSDSERLQCENGKSSFESAAQCVATLEVANDVPEDLAKSKLKAILPALRTSVDYVDHLQEKELSCQEEIKTKGEVSEPCYADFNRDRATLQDQILQLNIVKDKIGAENVDNMKFRNFALQKWHSQNCGSSETSMDMCAEDTILTKDAAMTAGDSMKIAAMFSTSAEDASQAEFDAEQMCNDDERKLKAMEEHLCQFFESDPSNSIANKNKPDESYSAPVNAPDGLNEETKIKDAWLQGGSNILRNALGSILNNQYQNQYVPYPYNYSPYGNGARPSGIADTIMFNARYYGAYGFYMPTPGYQPYTAFGTSSNFSGYKPVTTTSTKYFNF